MLAELPVKSGLRSYGGLLYDITFIAYLAAHNLTLHGHNL